MKKLIWAGWLFFCCSVVGMAQESVTRGSVTRIMGEEIVTRIYPLRWIEPRDMAGLLQPFITGRPFSVSPSDRFNTVTITAPEEQQSLFLELINKYDVPAKMVEFQFYILKASRQGQGVKNGLPERILKVLQEISSLTKYESFELLDTPILRVNEAKQASLDGKGVFFYSIYMDGPVIIPTDQGKAKLRIDRFSIQFSIPAGIGEKGPVYRNVGLTTSFSVDEGEIVVLGASQIGTPDAASASGGALITLVTARIVD